MSTDAGAQVHGLLLSAAGFAVSIGCATVNNGYMQQVTVASDPPAVVFACDELVGETPVTVRLKHDGWLGQGRGGAMLRFEKGGFRTTEIWAERRISRWIFGNLVLAAIAGAAAAAYPGDSDNWSSGRVAAGTLLWSAGIDFLSGAAFVFPRAVHTTLVPGLASAPRQAYPGDAPTWRTPDSFARGGTPRS